jgi:hypothetical protein
MQNGLEWNAESWFGYGNGKVWTIINPYWPDYSIISAEFKSDARVPVTRNEFNNVRIADARVQECERTRSTIGQFGGFAQQIPYIISTRPSFAVNCDLVHLFAWKLSAEVVYLDQSTVQYDLGSWEFLVVVCIMHKLFPSQQNFSFALLRPPSQPCPAIPSLESPNPSFTI